jgi:hypothetical protein
MHNVTRLCFQALLVISGVSTAFGAAEPPAATQTAPAIQAEATPLGPKIQFATPIHDFGRAQAGDLVKYSFVFTNGGDQSLEISNVQPSCGCTTAGDWSRKVAAGQTGTIPVQFNSANFNGQVFKTISVTSNDKQKPTVVLQLKGTVWKPIELAPQYSVINVPPDATSASATVRIINHMEEPLTVSAPESNNRMFGTTLTTNQPGKEYQLVIASVGELSTGNVQGKVTLQTSSSKTPVLDIPFWVNVQPVLSVIPQRISLPQAPLKVKAPATITIQNNSTNALTLRDAQVNVPGVDVQIKELQPGKLFNAVLTFPEGFEVPSGQLIALTMKSSQPRMPEIRVPVVQPARPVAPPMPELQPPAAGVPKPADSAQVVR